MTASDTTVIDDAEHQRFVYRQDGVEAELAYEVEDDRLILVHTGVPSAFRGQGIGGRLVRAAAERAAARGETVLPWCAYARKWLEDHPDVAATVTVDWRKPGA